MRNSIDYANEDIDGTILQEISILQSKLESYKLDKSIEEKNKKNKKATIWGGIIIGLIILGFILRFI